MTDADGVARLHIVRARYLTATKGADVALLPASSEYEWDSGDGERFGDRLRVRRPRHLSPGRDRARQGLVPARANVVGLDGDAAHRRRTPHTGRRTTRSGTTSATATSTLNAFSGFDLTINVPAGAALGAAQLDVSVDDGGVRGDASVTFQIQEFRRPEFEVVTRAESAGPVSAHPARDGRRAGPVLLGRRAGRRADGLAGDDQLDHVHAAELVATSRSACRRRTGSTTSAPDGGSSGPWPGRPAGAGRRRRVRAGRAAVPQPEQKAATYTGRTDATGTHYLQLNFEAQKPDLPGDGLGQRVGHRREPPELRVEPRAPRAPVVAVRRHSEHAAVRAAKAIRSTSRRS